MDNNVVVNAIQELGDLELAVLVCLLADQHCIVRAPEHILEDVQQELGLIAAKRFGLSSINVDCSPDTTLEEFGDALLLEDEGTEDNATVPDHKNIVQDRQHPGLTADGCVNRKTANVVIAKNLDTAHELVQILALEAGPSHTLISNSAPN